MPTESEAIAVAVAQFAPTDDRAANRDEIERLATIAARRGARLVVFPEYSSYFTPELGASWLDEAEDVQGGPFTAALGELADRLGVHLVAGLIERVPGERRVRNTVVAVAPGAGVVARYSKLHLYDAFGARESEWIAAGEIADPEVFAIGDLTFGLQTCYDARFPEVTRRLVDAGADVVCMPAEWVRGPLKEAHWRTLTTARALENTIYLVAADHAPPVGAGNSMVVDPMGVELATIGEATDVALAWLSSERIAAVRRVNPALALRRFTVTER
ncbi:carbon-nitrogen hydrolase family protein [Agromyces aerolatus]|uniref:carbon-nitrogen hydrolase family protein n=1 Tax=Agromyces sp. LY-1074 TaxID=3074080 RepID=UPI00285AA641|nr:MULTISPECIES: carbon-nitrogen hydrolase family protein [unclassified Agromyces]MDR5698968.1 carbon-nitrogen hydrolase family protein [Agromyces sp. LY-1074]MDR5705254.1 carbon-nitrogen hydrolase family protein [Agromyces sp. LY-1358]